MRDVINKNVTEEQLLQTAERVFSRGWKAMKLYFMIGLPTEEEEDVREIPRVGGRARAIGKRVKKELGVARRRRRSPSASRRTCPSRTRPSSGARWTRPRSCARSRAGSSRRRARRTSSSRCTTRETSWLEAVFARGDRPLGAGARARVPRRARASTRGRTRRRWSIWEEAFRAEGIEPAKYLGTIPATARLPWDHIDVGLEEGFLLREYRKAMKNRLSLPCGKVAGAFVHATNLQDARGRGPEARLLRLRRRVRSLRDARAAPRVPAKARRRTSRAPPAPRPQARPKGPPDAARPGGAASLPIPLREARRRRVPVASRRHPRAPAFVPPARAAPLLLAGLSSEAGHDVRSGALARRGEPVRGRRHQDRRGPRRRRRCSKSCPPGLSRGCASSAGRGSARTIPGSRRSSTWPRYVVGVPRAAIASRGGEAWLRDRIAAACRGARARASSDASTAIGKRVDVRDFLRSIARRRRGAASLARAGIVGDLDPDLPSRSTCVARAGSRSPRSSRPSAIPSSRTAPCASARQAPARSEASPRPWSSPALRKPRPAAVATTRHRERPKTQGGE